MNQVLMLVLSGLAITNGAQNPYEQLQELLKEENIPSPEAIINQDDVCLNTFRQLVVNKELKINLDPLTSPDIVKEFYIKPHRQPIHVELKLTDGQQYGFDTVYRNGNVVLTYDENFYYLTTQRSFKKLTIKYNYLINILDRSINGTLSADVDGVDFRFIILVNRKTFKIDIQNFEIKRIGDIDVKVNNKFLSKNPTVITNIFKNLIETFTIQQIGQVVLDLIQEANNNI